MAPRIFTLAEANALLPTLRHLVARLLQARQRIVDAQPGLWPVLAQAAGNGGSPLASAVARDFGVVQAQVRAIAALGVELKDLNTGLVDFRSLRDGREIYLCWRYDEPAVDYWHELDAGLAGRQPL